MSDMLPAKKKDISISHLRNLNIASVSDIHLGHNRNVAENIIANLDREFPDNAETAKLNLIFIAGDVFDTLLFLSRDAVAEIKLWITRFLRRAKKNGTIVRVLEGTPSHDRKQSMLFPLINEMLEINADVKHVTELSIERIDKLGLDVLYIPDEWTDSPDKTFEQVVDLMNAKGLSQVDFAVMHGSFNYQLNPMIKAPRHSEDHYLSIVREYIFVGHIHHHSVYKRIIAQGSFDRLAHGEEEAKGHVRVYYDADGNRRIKFIENKGAMIFKTVNCTGLEIGEILDKVKAVMEKLPENAFVRIEAERENPIFSTFEVLIRQYPLVTWSKLPRDENEEVEEVNIVPDEEDSFVPVTITRDNIVSLLMDRLVRQGVPDAVRARCEMLLLEAA